MNNCIADLNQIETLTIELYSGKKNESFIQLSNSISNKYINTLDSFIELFLYFEKTNNQTTLFWIIDLLCKIIETNYINNYNNNMKETFRNLLKTALVSNINTFKSYNAIANKFSYLVIIWLKYEYPENWGQIFTEFKDLALNNNKNNEELNIKVDMFVNILLIFDDELIKYRHTFDNFLDSRSTIIKDSLREDKQLVDIISFLTNILSSNINNNNFLYTDKIVFKSFKALANLIDWNNLNLFSDLIPVTQKFITSSSNIKFIKAALEIYQAFCVKGMLINEKIEVLQTLKVFDLLENYLINIKATMENDLIYVLSDIVQNLGIYFIEGLNMSLKEEHDQNTIMNLIEMLNYLISKSILIIKATSKQQDFKTASINIDFVSEFLLLIKHNPNSYMSFKISIDNILSIVEELLIIPKSISLTTNQEYRHDEDLKSFRKEFLIIYQNLFNINELKETMLSRLFNRILQIQDYSMKFNKTNYINSCSTLHEAEHALFLLSNIDNSGSINTLDINHKQLVLESLFPNNIAGNNLNINIDFLNFPSETIMLLYLDSLVKHVALYINKSDLIDYVIKVFTGDKGIFYKDSLKITSIISQTLQKFVDKTRNNLPCNSCLVLLDAVQKFIENLVSSNNYSYINEFSNMYQCFGLLINTSSINNSSNSLNNFNNKRNDCLLGLLNSFISFFNNGNDNDKFNLVSKLIINFFKAFNSEVKALKEIFYNFIKTFYFDIFKSDNNILYNNSNILIMINLFQKVLIIVGKESLILIDDFLNFIQNNLNTVNINGISNNQINNISCDVYENLLKLLINISSTLKKDSFEFLLKHLGYFYNNIKVINLPKNLIAETDRFVITIYTYLITLLFNISSDFVDLLYNLNLNIHDSIVDFLINCCLNFIESGTKKKAFKCMKGIIVYLSKTISVNTTSNINQEFSANESSKILYFTLMLAKELNINDINDYNTFIDIMTIHQISFKNSNIYYCNLINSLLKTEEQAKNFLYDMFNKAELKKLNKDQISNLYSIFKLIINIKAI